MSEQMVFESLRGVEFFRGIADDHLTRLAGISKLVEFPAQSIIFRENEAASDVYAIVSGRVSLVICTPSVGCRQLMEASAGELIGWSPLVERSRLSDTARALTETKAIAMDGPKLLEMCHQHPFFGFELMQRAAKVLAQRLNAARLQLLDMGGVRLPEVQIESD